jgi:Protein of unknown function (DUF4231)
MSRQKANSLDDLVSAIELIDLDDSKKKIIIYRFTALLREYRGRSFRYSISFHTLRITITVGSLIVPALLSVQGAAMSSIVYWCVWVLSLCVTISNGVMTLFKVDKKYYVLHTTFHHLVSEGWQYIELTGRYDGNKTPGFPVTHDTQFKIFCRSLEKIRMKQVEDEYFRVPELRENASPTGPQQLSPDIYSSSSAAPRPGAESLSPRADPFQSPQNLPPSLNGMAEPAVRLQAEPRIRRGAGLQEESISVAASAGRQDTSPSSSETSPPPQTNSDDAV